MKKRFSLIFAVLLLAISMVFTVSAAKATPVVSLSDEYACAGQTVTLIVSVEGNAYPGIGTAYYHFNYDQDVLTLTSALAGRYENGHLVEPYIFSMGTFAPDVSKDLVTYISFGSYPRNGPLLALTFKVSENAANGRYVVSISDDSYMKTVGLEELDFEIVAGSITVGHRDGNKDHACDNGCGVYQGEHTDSASDKNHDCDICGEKDIEGHTPGTKATCTTPQVCTECDKELDSKLGHNFITYVPNGDATCTDSGTETATCDRCEATDTRAIQGSPAGHNWGEWISVSAPTYEKAGQEQRKCLTCNYVEEKKIDPLDREHNTVTTPSTYKYWYWPLLLLLLIIVVLVIVWIKQRRKTR